MCYKSMKANGVLRFARFLSPCPAPPSAFLLDVVGVWLLGSAPLPSCRHSPSRYVRCPPGARSGGPVSRRGGGRQRSRWGWPVTPQGVGGSARTGSADSTAPSVASAVVSARPPGAGFPWPRGPELAAPRSPDGRHAYTACGIVDDRAPGFPHRPGLSRHSVARAGDRPRRAAEPVFLIAGARSTYPYPGLRANVTHHGCPTPRISPTSRRTLP
jgi:hypothetical protein